MNEWYRSRYRSRSFKTPTQMKKGTSEAGY